jgi:NAD(P)-dependent dehydrogenase (short-subunit alcohol dehydrogenase family)
MSRNGRTARGKVVVITGGARGIGYAIARRLLADGAKVAIGDIDEAKLAESAKKLGIICYGRLDVTDSDAFDAFLDRVEDELGLLDVLVNNAGIMPVGHFHEEEDTVTRRVLDINVLGVMYGTKLALRRMLPRRSGHIVNISSLAGESYVPGGVTYCASKHAVKAFTESVRREYRNSGVAVSQVMPIFVNTELITGAPGVRALPNAEPEQVAEAVARLIARPKPRVWVTKYAGAVVSAQNFVPHQVAEAMGRLMGAETNFLAAAEDPARKTYEDRIRAKSTAQE